VSASERDLEPQAAEHGGGFLQRLAAGSWVSPRALAVAGISFTSRTRNQVPDVERPPGFKHAAKLDCSCPGIFKVWPHRKAEHPTRNCSAERARRLASTVCHSDTLITYFVTSNFDHAGRDVDRDHAARWLTAGRATPCQIPVPHPRRARFHLIHAHGIESVGKPLAKRGQALPPVPFVGNASGRMRLVDFRSCVSPIVL